MATAIWRGLAAAGVLLLAGCQQTKAVEGAAQKAAETMKQARIVFLGDSITDGFSYPTLVRQALREAGKPVPVCIGAGIGGDTAKGMRARLQRDVLVHKPTLMTLSAGVNDANGGVKLEDYLASVRGILDTMKQENVEVVVMTTSILADKCPAAARETIASYNVALRALAKERGLKLADVFANMQKAQAGGTELMEADGIHPNYAGHRVMARAVLDALGFAALPVPEKMQVELYPGVVTPWRLKAVTDAKAPWLDAAAVAALTLDGGWATLALPEPEPQGHWWGEQTRQEGFALSLEKLCGKAGRYMGCATVKTDAERLVYFNVGAALQTIWLNGKQIYKNDGTWRGYHPGRERIAATLKPGENALVIETGNQFFLSISDMADNRNW